MLRSGIFAILIACGTSSLSLAECLFLPTVALSTLQQRYQPATVLVDVVGPEPEACRDAGTGVLVSDNGLVMTARHVVVKTGCSKTGVFLRFSWAPDSQIEAEVVNAGPLDVAFLKPVDDSWNAGAANFCTAPVSKLEAKADEPFVRFGRVALRLTAYAYMGNVILPSSQAGRPPMQLVCSIIYPMDSGGPVFSATSGDLVGVTVERVDQDEFGSKILNRGLVLPTSSMMSLYEKNFDSNHVCNVNDIILAGGGPWEIEVPYQFTIEPSAASRDYTPLQARIFKPQFGFLFTGIDNVIALAADGSAIEFGACQIEKALPPNAVCAEISLGGKFLTVKSSRSEAPSRINAVTIYTRQQFGSTGVDWLRIANLSADLVARVAAGEVLPEDREVILQALARAPAEAAQRGSALVAVEESGYSVSAQPPTERWVAGDKGRAVINAIDAVGAKLGF